MEGNNGGKGMAAASLVLGIISVVCATVFGWLFWLVWVGVVCGIIAIVLSVMAKKQGAAGMAIAGLVLGIIGVVIGAITGTCSTCVYCSAKSAANALVNSYKYLY